MTDGSKLTGADLSEVNMLARRYANGTDPTAIDQVAEMLAACLNDAEEARIVWWWNEGARDYASDMDHLGELNTALILRRAELFPAE